MQKTEEMQVWSLGRPSGGGHGNPLQYSCLENPRDRGAWQVSSHRVAKSQTQLKQLNTHTHTHTHTHTPPLWIWVKSGVESMSKMPSLPLVGMQYRILTQQLSKPLGMEIWQWQFYPRAKFGLVKRQGCPFAGVHSSTSKYVFLNMEFMSSWQHLVFRMCLGKRN